MSGTYQWYNNGRHNKKVYDIIPEGYVIGYILVKDKIKRIRKLNDDYERRRHKLKSKFEEKLAKLEEEQLIKQKEIIDF